MSDHNLDLLEVRDGQSAYGASVRPTPAEEGVQ